MLSVNLLYENSELGGGKPYHDTESIVNDLGLNHLFENAAINQQARNRAVRQTIDIDNEIHKAMRKVMMTPLRTEEELKYRQAVLKDFLSNPDFTEKLYDAARRLIAAWKKHGKDEREKGNFMDNQRQLISEIKLLHIFLKSLTEIKLLSRRYKPDFNSRGLRSFCERLETEYSDEWEKKIRKVLDDLRFFCDDEESEEDIRFLKRIPRSNIVLEGAVGTGFKFSDLKLDSVSTQEKLMQKRKSTLNVFEKLSVTFSSEPMIIAKDEDSARELSELENEIAIYIFSYLQGFSRNCRDFFEALLVQSAFYAGCNNLYIRCRQIKVNTCYPTVCTKERMRFENLMELSMGLCNRKAPVGNDGDIADKMLLIVTGANQGGKSTFLRSIGVAQIMMQSGLFVAAKRYESSLFPNFFTHFVRREDTAMNSGRLDEELGRINRIVNNLGKDSLVLLNESFATTTEEEGSVISYDIIKALGEVGVKVFTVTHLLSFAKRVYGEQRADAAFLCAERMEDGTRTYKMIEGEPELTSFGLDLYDKVIGGDN